MYKYIFISLISVLFFASCEDVVDVELNEGQAQLVVDAWLDNNSQRQEIRLTQSAPYFDSSFAPIVENAEVSVSSDNGTSYEFQYEGNGVYVHMLAANETLGNVGDSFELDIVIDDKLYTAESVMHRVPQVDSIVQEFREAEVFTDEGIYCQFYARDFSGLGDTYWIKTFKNDSFLNLPFEINLAYDAGFDSGGEVDGLIFISPIRELINENDIDGIPIPYVPGDEVRVEIHSISNDAFAFLEIMRDQLLNSNSGLFAEPLANAPGNVTHANGNETVLGVFNVAAVASKVKLIE